VASELFQGEEAARAAVLASTARNRGAGSVPTERRHTATDLL